MGTAKKIKMAEINIQDLLQIFEKFGEVGEPGDLKSIPYFDVLPKELKEMFLLAQDWHLQTNSVNVFGINFMFAKDAEKNKLMIFGDEGIRDDWKYDHASPNCAEDDWLHFCTISEFDFIFVNT